MKKTYDIVDAAAQEYAEKYTTPPNELLRNLLRDTHLHQVQSHMLSGPLQGMLLSLISRMIRPERILEVGTFTGYSALCLAEGLQPGGQLHTIDNNEELEEECRRYFRSAGMDDRIQLHIGAAAEVIPQLEGPFDLVFLDADKTSYSLYFDLVIGKMRPGAFLIADNMFFHGEVLQPEEKQSNNAKAIIAFNKKVAADPRVEQVMLTLRDGILLVQKVEGI
ncbi:O-methyltransferase [Compostibacter hankyongensis]|uniref:O-methyltransferase n=1 Tax=Compostibacter hankyongensis TaxID=1007089 RepID=A0ABP8FYC2_9BACT